MKSRKGWSVAIKRTDESEFLAFAGQGLLPAVFTDRRYAMSHKRDLISRTFKCRVVRVEFTDVRVIG